MVPFTSERCQAWVRQVCREGDEPPAPGFNRPPDALRLVSKVAVRPG